MVASFTASSASRRQLSSASFVALFVLSQLCPYMRVVQKVKTRKLMQKRNSLSQLFNLVPLDINQFLFYNNDLCTNLSIYLQSVKHVQYACMGAFSDIVYGNLVYVVYIELK